LKKKKKNEQKKKKKNEQKFGFLMVLLYFAFLSLACASCCMPDTWQGMHTIQAFTAPGFEGEGN
jgi:hypothetical protein